MVGTPVHRQRVVPGPRPELDPQTPEYSLDGPDEWVDEATYPDQIFRGPEFWKLDHVEVKVFDMSNAEHIKEYAALLTIANTPGANRCVSTVERKFSEDIHNWRIFVEIQHIKYRKLLKGDRKTKS
jgi:hypothetical protein